MESGQTIISWLESGGKPEANKIAGQRRWDLSGFHKAVGKEIAVPQRLATESPTAPPMLIFSNRLVRQGKYLLLREQTAAEEFAIHLTSSDNFILTSSPLARPEMFERALKGAGRRCDPARHDFVLVTKSHGNDEMALTPRLVVRASETTKEELLTVATGALP